MEKTIRKQAKKNNTQPSRAASARLGLPLSAEHHDGLQTLIRECNAELARLGLPESVTASWLVRYWLWLERTSDERLLLEETIQGNTLPRVARVAMAFQARDEMDNAAHAFLEQLTPKERATLKRAEELMDKRALALSAKG